MLFRSPLAAPDPLGLQGGGDVTDALQGRRVGESLDLEGGRDTAERRCVPESVHGLEE